MKNESKKNIFFVLVVFMFVLLGYWSINLQIVNGENYLSESLGYIVEERYSSPPRGLFVDRNGEILANNREYFDVYLRYSKDISNEFENFSEYLDKNNPDLKNKLPDSIDSELEQDQKVLIDLDKSQVNLVSEYIEDNNNYYSISGYRRQYLYPEAFAHIIGYTSVVDLEDIENGYSPNDSIGKYRLEKQLEVFLKGTKEKSIKTLNTEIIYPGEQGDTVYLTIDLEWQLKLYELFDEYNSRYGAGSGAGVILNTETGEVVAMVSAPAFEPNQFVRGIRPDEYNHLVNVRSQPLLDKAISTASTPGSIFKVISSLFFLENEIINPETQYTSTGCIKIGDFDFCEFGKVAHGLLNLESALYKSSNLYYCNFMRDYVSRNDYQDLYTFAHDLGFDKNTGIDLEGEVDGLIDSPTYKQEVSNDSWFPGDTCNSIIGQGTNLVTPLQMANLFVTLENQGEILKPFVVNSVIDTNGEKVMGGNTIVNNIINIEEEHIEAIYKGMSGVAYNPGSATYYFLNGLDNNIRAKTGSAETVENINGTFVEQTHSWIVGTFDHGSNRYSFALFQQYGGGGYYITPMLRDFLQFINTN